MTGFTVYFIDGGYTNFPLGGDQADVVIEWYKTAPPDHFITLNTETGGAIHTQQKSISRIAVEAG